MTKVYIAPSLEEAPYGIKRLIEAMYKHLPELGIQIVDSEEEADVVNAHAMALVKTDKPVVYTSHGLYWADHYWPTEYGIANQKMIDYMCRSQAITAVSDWVAMSLKRGLNRPISTIYHGIDADDWIPIDPENVKGYVSVGS